MDQPLKTDAIEKFLIVKAPIDMAKLYNPEMEVQVNVAQDGGEKTEGQYQGKAWRGWTDGFTVWKAFRIPYNANSEPHFDISEVIRFDLATHAEGIGMTGWNWKKKQSLWVAYDFDAITGHSDRHKKKLTEDELNNLIELVQSVEWVTLRRSTGGKGLHLYVFLEPITTSTHTEHAALARAILAKLSATIGFDFSTKVDICGGNMWVWHRKMTPENHGLELIKQGVKLTDIPANWRDHIQVAKGARKRNLPQFIEELQTDDAESLFEELTGQRTKVPLDSEHKKLIEFLTQSGCLWWWDADHHMLVTHTSDLKDAHEALQLKGPFKTVALGSEKHADHNCFCFSGNTEVITKQGIRTLKELYSIGKAELYIYNGEQMIWQECKINSFGIQKTYNMHFGNGSVHRATIDHRWPLYKNNKIQLANPKKSFELTKEHYIPLAKFKLPEIDWEGYAHGFVFGDGQYITEKDYCEVPLYGYDSDLKPLLLKYGKYGNQKVKDSYVDVIRHLPKHWKELPKNPTKEYALGFILGFCSADGYLENGMRIYQSDYDVLEETRKLAIYVGLRAFAIAGGNERWNQPNIKLEYNLSISTYNLTKDHFLRTDHKENLNINWQCNSTSLRFLDYESCIEEEVFCAVVPFYENFTLADNIITKNCFPLRSGGWAVRRYSPGCAESDSWDQDGSGFTRCFYNRAPDLSIAARINEGIEHPQGGYFFNHAEQALKAVRELGGNVDIPAAVGMRKTRLKLHKNDNKIIMEFNAEPTDSSEQLKGWLNEKGKMWSRVIPIKFSAFAEPEVNLNLDDTIRHLVTSSAEDYGWVVKSEGSWREEPITHVKPALESLGYATKEVTKIIGSSVFRAWTVVNIPFNPEYPGDRKWNRKAPQLAYQLKVDIEDLKFPTWLRILKHLGKNLDDAINKHSWCVQNGIFSGADYLMCWIASLFQDPLEPLPYLFFYGAQDNGKSTFHEAISTLMTSGVIRADAALTSQSAFNGELETSVLCVTEETDLRKNKNAYNRIKDWVTSRDLLVHRKHSQPYTISNTTHWIQCSNDHLACPVFQGDTRITMIYVEPLEDKVPRKEFETMLKKEAVDFLTHVMSIELPTPLDRLNIPVIVTDEKLLAEENNLSFLESFIREKCFYVKGSVIKFSDFCDHYYEWLDPSYHQQWSKIRIGRELPPIFAKGKDPNTNIVLIGNMSLEQKDHLPFKYVIKDGKLEPVVIEAKNGQDNGRTNTLGPEQEKAVTTAEHGP